MSGLSEMDKYKCAERELIMRKKVYPRWVQLGRISAGKAAHELACMEAILRDYMAAIEKDRLL